MVRMVSHCRHGTASLAYCMLLWLTYLGISGCLWASLGLSWPPWASLGLFGPIWASLGLSGPI